MKVLKVAAIVVGAVALAATGVGLAAGFGVAAGVGALTAGIGLTGLGATIGTALLAGAALYDVASLANTILPKPSQGGSQTKWKADPYAGLPYAMGRTLVAGNIVYRRGSGGNNDYEQFVTVLSIGPITSIDATFMNKTTVAFDGSGAAIGTYNGYIWQRQQLGACPEATALTPGAGAAPGWTAQHKLSGLAAVMNSFRYDAKSKNGLTTEPQPGWIGHFVKVYDPVQDDTYPGGSGPCRALQEDTYVWSEDPHLHALTWCLGRWQNGVRVAGWGAPIAAIDVPAFVEGRNLNIARGWKIGGQVVTRPDTIWNSLKSMLQAGGAKPVIVGGRISCINRAPRVSLATITRDDIVGQASFAGTQQRRSRINGIIPQYRSEAHDWEMVSASAVSIADYVALDGDERTKEVPYPLVQQVDQAAQLATYDICDAREAGPGSVPLKPWWFNYRIGDCLTFEPEEGLSIKVMVTGRTPEPSSGIVTYDVIGETAGKHDLALGQTGIAPPIASIVYDRSVPAPGADAWSITGTTLSSASGSIPAIEVDGACDNDGASVVLFEVRPHVGGQDDGTGWEAAGTEAPATTRKVITSVSPETAYDVAVSYRVRGVIGDRLVLGPVTAGQLTAGNALQQAVLNSWIVEVSAGETVLTANADGTVDIGANTRRYPDGHADVACSAGTLSTGLAAGATGMIAYDDPERAGGAVTYTLYTNDNDAHASAANPGRHYMGYFTIPTTGSAGGGGGGVSGGYCVTADTPILTANENGPGMEKVAADLKVGDQLWTQHEITMRWGSYAISAIELVDDQPVFAATVAGRRLRGTADHLVWADAKWQRLGDIGVMDGSATIARITVDEAHTYVSNGVLSHNIKATQQVAG